MKKFQLSFNQLFICVGIAIGITMFSIPVSVTGGFYTTTFYGRAHIIDFISTSIQSCTDCYQYGIDLIPLILQLLLLFLIPAICFAIYNLQKKKKKL